MPKNDRYDVEESPTPGLPKNAAEQIFVQPNVVKPRGPDRTQLQAENEELKGQLANLMEQLQSRTNDLAIQDGNILVHDFQLTPMGLIAPENMTLESWEQVGNLLFRLEGSLQWLLGDWIVYGGVVGWGDLPKLAEALGRDYQTLRNYTVVCRAYDLYRRRYNLTFGHYQAVASLDETEQDEKLAYAEQQGLSVAAFRKWLKGDEKPILPAREQLTPKFVWGQADKFFDRDPSKAKPAEVEEAQSIGRELLRTAREYARKWGLEE